MELIHLNHMDIKPCKACERGWGQCHEGECIQKDDLETIWEADAFVSPVYWHDLSESAKRLLDRLRRVEAFSSRDTFVGIKTIGVAAAGGWGNGAVRTLQNLEDYLKWMRFERVDLVTITKFSRDHKLPMLENAGKLLAQGIPGGDEIRGDRESPFVVSGCALGEEPDCRVRALIYTWYPSSLCMPHICSG